MSEATTEVRLPERYPRPAKLDEVPLDQHAVIEASAGTGKTYTLEHLILELMLAREIPIEQILVMTFTERATSELKLRVRNLLEKIVTGDFEEAAEEAPHWKIDEGRRQFLERQLFGFDRAPIHTIHGFCNRILSDNAFHLRRLFDQELASAKTIFDVAFKHALRTRFARQPELQPYLEAWLAQGDLESLQRELFKVVRARAILKPSWDADDLLERIAIFRDENPSVDPLVDEIYRVAQGSMPPQQAQEWADRAGRVADRLHACRGEADLVALLAELGEERVTWLIKQSRRRPACEAEAALYPLIGRLAPLTAATLNRFAPVVEEVLDDEKSKGLFDYDDMLRLVWQRLDDASDGGGALLRFLRERYRYALVDEFQDTDDVQWSIFRRVFFESYDANGVPANVLYVIGDPKQAIYAFRGADVHTYMRAREAILDGGGAKVQLTENFRSTGALIDAYNAVFDQQADKPLFTGPIRYDAPVSCGKAELRALEAGQPTAPIEMVRVVPKGDKIYARQLKGGLASWMADRIARILGDEAIWIDDGDEGEGRRRVRARDIFVLTRTKSEERLVGDYLRARGVPFAFYKQEGLFQTEEAQHVLDLLVAIDNPYRASNRLKAWTTPFFEVGLEDLSRCAGLAETHPLFAHLVSWHEMAGRHEFERLFGDVLERSGIVRREIFLKASERELTNYQHIFEILLEEAGRGQLDMRGLVLRMRGFITEAAAPESDEENFQRLESERDAVQVMTVHKSKGLEADVVFVFGGFSNNPKIRFFDCHWNEQRILHIGKPFLPQAERAIGEEQREENQRLLYVALTRARAKLVLPYIGRSGGRLEYGYLNGLYGQLNDRLHAVVARLDEDPRLRGCRLHQTRWEGQQSSGLSKEGIASFSEWSPQEEFSADEEQAARLEALRRPPLIISSYSRMKRTSGGYSASLDADAFKAEISTTSEAWRAKGELPGGTGPGVFLHAILEECDFSTFANARLDLDGWRQMASVSALFDRMMRQHGVEELYRPYCERLVYHALATPFGLPCGGRLEAIARCEHERREVEFLFPIPEPAHPRLDELPDGPFGIERGFLKGYIDLVFIHEGRVYFADWKSDSLDAFDEESLDAHVDANYRTQAMLYSLAILKMFGIRGEEAYEERFGGYMYVFLRGVDGSEDRGFYLRRPAYDDLLAYERELVGTEFR